YIGNAVSLGAVKTSTQGPEDHLTPAGFRALGGVLAFDILLNNRLTKRERLFYLSATGQRHVNLTNKAVPLRVQQKWGGHAAIAYPAASGTTAAIRATSYSATTA